MADRGSISFLLLALLVVFGALSWAGWSVYEGAVSGLFNVDGKYPFVDLADVLQAGICWKHGVNVYAPNACLHGGVFNYSPFLLQLAHFPIGLQDRIPGGFLLAVGFAASLSLLPASRSGAERLFYCCAAVSTTTWYAIEQGNFDLALFAIIVLGVWLIQKGFYRSKFGYLLFAFAAATKFYPAVLFVFAIREGFVVLAYFALAVCVAALVMSGLFGHSIMTVFTLIPISQPFRATFGAIDLPLGLALLHVFPWVWPLHSIRPFYPSTTISAVQPFCGWAKLCLSVVAVSFGIVSAKHYEPRLRSMNQDRLLYLIAGASVIIFCFFVTQNVYYRALFLVMTIPGVWDMAFLQPTSGNRCIKWLAFIILALLWETLFRAGSDKIVGFLFPSAVLAGWQELFWLARELMWWWVMVEYTAIVAAFLKNETSRVYTEARRIFQKKLT